MKRVPLKKERRVRRKNVFIMKSWLVVIGKRWSVVRATDHRIPTTDYQLTNSNEGDKVPDQRHHPLGVNAEPKKQDGQDGHSDTTNDVHRGVQHAGGLGAALMLFKHDGYNLDIIVQTDDAVDG